MQHYVIKFVSGLRQVGAFLQELRFPPPIKLTAMILCISEILLKVVLDTITPLFWRDYFFLALETNQTFFCFLKMYIQWCLIKNKLK